MDGIDTVAVRFDDNNLCEILDARSVAYPDSIRRALIDCRRSEAALALSTVSRLDRAIGNAFGDAARQAIEALGPHTKVAAIGSHGQTLWHAPDGAEGSSLQLGDPNAIAERTGVLTIADFRRADVVRGGQGAPLAPLFHDFMMRDANATTFIINLGGIANVTELSPGQPVVGFDTGPANGLMDQWLQATTGQAFDESGRLAAKGNLSLSLLERLLTEPYFSMPPPKSTGFETFNVDWLRELAGELLDALSTEDVIATLMALSVRSISDAISVNSKTRVALVGGGRSNPVLVRKLHEALAPAIFFDTHELGVGADWIEATLFAWLARERLAGRAINTPPITGAQRAGLLGAVFSPN